MGDIFSPQTEKARNIQALGAKGGIVMDNVPSSSINDSPMFAMSGDGTDDVSIPMLFLFDRDAKALFKALSDNQELVVTMQESFRKWIRWCHAFTPPTWISISVVSKNLREKLQFRLSASTEVKGSGEIHGGLRQIAVGSQISKCIRRKFTSLEWLLDLAPRLRAASYFDK